jgi:hypothetical protein
MHMGIHGVQPLHEHNGVRDSAVCLEDVWERLLVDGYTIVKDTEPDFGFDPNFRQYAINAYFDGGQLAVESYNVFPPDRERARDVIHYAQAAAELLLVEHAVTTIADRTYHQGERQYGRVQLLQDPLFRQWLQAAIDLVPPTPHFAESTLGVNLFRTRGDVVNGPHRDDEQLVMVYVVDKVGEGGTSTLYTDESDEPFFAYTLVPGQMLVFDDQRFRHSATPLRPGQDGQQPHRDTIVCTVNKPETYPFTPLC